MILSTNIRRILFAVFAATALVFSFYAVIAPTPTHAAVIEDIKEGATQAAGEAAQAGVQGFFGCQDFGSCITRGIVQIGIWTLQFSLFILSIVGVFLDLMLLLTFNMGAILGHGTAAGDAIAAAWTIFRDLVNLMFIAGFVWVSIAMILQINVTGGSNGKFIANIIIAALLVNFSYFFAGVIIDASNTTSRLIYQEGLLNGQSVELSNTPIVEMVKKVVGGQGFITENPDGTVETYAAFIGSQFIHQTKLLSILDPSILTDQANANPTITLGLVTYSGMILIGLTIELFVAMFFAIAARFVILIVLLILSPLVVFRIMGIPPFSKWGEQWWKTFMSQIIFLPVFIFMLAVSFRVISGFATTLASGDVTLGRLITDPSGGQFEAAIGLVILFVIAYGLLKASKTVAQNISQEKQVELPNAAWLQGKAASLGGAVGGRASAVARLPKTISLLGLGAGLRTIGAGSRAIADATGVSEKVGGAAENIKAYTPGVGNRYEYERSQRAKKAVPKDFKETLQKTGSDIERLKRLQEGARSSGNVQQEVLIAEQLERTKASRKGAYNDFFDKLGPEKAAQQFRAFSKEEQDKALGALGPEKAKQVTDIWNKGQGKAGTEELKLAKDAGIDREGKGPEASGPAPVATLDTTSLLSELQSMNQGQRAEAMRERKADMKELTASTEGIARLKSELGAGALGSLPSEIIINENGALNENVVREIEVDDLAVLAGRQDITNEQYGQIKKAMSTTAERRAVVEAHEMSPSALARSTSAPEPEPSAGTTPPPAPESDDEA